MGWSESCEWHQYPGGRVWQACNRYWIHPNDVQSFQAREKKKLIKLVKKDDKTLTYFNFNTVEDFAIVNSNNWTNHLWHNNHIPKVSFDNSRFLILTGFFLGSSQFLQQCHMLPLKSTAEATADSRTQHLKKLVPVSNQKHGLKSWLTLCYNITYMDMSSNWSKSTPRKVNLRKVRFFLVWSSAC